MWLLLLLDAAGRSALAPLPVARLHRLVYLANAMAPVYDLQTPDGYILKFKRGPFFPQVQWDVDRMSVQGLVEVTSQRRVEDGLGWRFDADYALSGRGMAAVDEAAALEDVGRKAAFLREVVRAFASMRLKGGEQDESLLQDVAYARADEDAAIDFRSAADNLTALAAATVASTGEDEPDATRRAEVHVYFRYLERLWVRRSEAARVA